MSSEVFQVPILAEDLAADRGILRWRNATLPRLSWESDIIKFFLCVCSCVWLDLCIYFILGFL